MLVGAHLANQNRNYAAERMSSQRNGTDKMSKFGTYRAHATMGAKEENPLSPLLIYGYELSRNNSFA
jgi:hypothetical protein